MSNNDQIQNALVMLIEGFEEFQTALEIKHLGTEVDEDTAIEELPADKLEQMDEEFHQAMLLTFENLGAENKVDFRDIGAVATILLDTVEEVAPDLFQDEDLDDLGDDSDGSGDSGSADVGNDLNSKTSVQDEAAV